MTAKREFRHTDMRILICKMKVPSPGPLNSCVCPGMVIRLQRAHVHYERWSGQLCNRHRLCTLPCRCLPLAVHILSCSPSHPLVAEVTPLAAHSRLVPHVIRLRASERMR